MTSRAKICEGQAIEANSRPYSENSIMPRWRKSDKFGEGCLGIWWSRPWQNNVLSTSAGDVYDDSHRTDCNVDVRNKKMSQKHQFRDEI